MSAATIDTRYTTAGERRVATKVVTDALATGYAISVFDGEETTVSKSAVRADILRAMATTEEDRLTFWKDEKRLGWVSLIWGNDHSGSEVISDYSANEVTEKLLAGAIKLADSLDA